MTRINWTIAVTNDGMDRERVRKNWEAYRVLADLRRDFIEIRERYKQ